MSEHTRPNPATAELVARADRVHATVADRAMSRVGYWSPEIAGAVAVGGGGAALVHPAFVPVAGVLLVARIVAARIRQRREGRADEPEQKTGARRVDAANHTDETGDSAEGVA